MTTQRAHLPGVGLSAGRLTEPLLLAAIASSFGAFLCWAGPPGTDFAAHAYQRTVFIDHGFQLWNNLWYAGHYSFITYSILYYPLAAVLGIRLLAVGTVAIGTFAFAVLLDREWGAVARWSSVAFALVWGMFVLTGAFPFALGISLALLAMWAMQAGASVSFALFSGLTLTASPLAFLLLALFVTGMALAGRGVGKRLVWPALTIAALGGVEVILWRAFASGGRFPFSLKELEWSLGYCASMVLLTWRVERARVLRFCFLAYGAACVVVYLVPSAIGQNVDRIRFVAIPVTVLALSLRRWRPRLVSAALLSVVIMWNLSPLAASVLRGSEPSASEQYWQPAISFLKSHLTDSYRVEVVGTARHWEAVYLPGAGIPLTRGWFRQDDFPQNEALYEPLTASRYRDWLRSLGVRYVVLTSAMPDYSARAEAALIRSGSSGLQPVLRAPELTVMRVPSPRRLISGASPARVVALSQTWLVLRLQRAGPYRVAIRYSPYWEASGGCVTPTKAGLMLLTVRHAGVFSLAFKVSPERVLDVLTSEPRTSCAAAGSSVG